MPSSKHTGNTTALFQDARPAWELGVNLAISVASSGTVSRAGLAQQFANSNRGRYILEYKVARNRTARQQALLTRQQEMTAPVWVPFWPMRALLNAPLASGGTAALLSITPTIDWFAPGDYVLIYEPAFLGQKSWRQVVSSSGQTLTLAALVGSPGFAAGARVAPARLCVRQSEQQTEMQHEAAEIESLHYRTL